MSVVVAYFLTLGPLAFILGSTIFFFVRFSIKNKKSIKEKLKSRENKKMKNSQVIKRVLFFSGFLIFYVCFCFFTHEASMMLIVAACLSGATTIIHQIIIFINNAKNSAQNNNQVADSITKFNMLKLIVQDGADEDSLVIDCILHDENNGLKTNQYFYVEEISVRFCHDIIAFQKKNKEYLESVYDKEANFTVLNPIGVVETDDDCNLTFRLETNKNNVSVFKNAFRSFYDSKILILDIFYSIEKDEQFSFSKIKNLLLKNDLNSQKIRLYFEQKAYNGNSYIYKIAE